MSLPRFSLSLALLVLSILPAWGGDWAEEVAADDPAVSIMGRVAVEGGVARMGFPGVTVRFRYAGPAPVLRMNALKDTCYFDVSLNGGRPVTMRLEEGRNEVALPFAEGEAAGSVVEIVRRTESWMGEVEFLGLGLPAGSELLAPPAWPERKLMFIGDSTTCGEFNERFPPTEDISPRTTNVARSYGMILAERLNAQVHVVGYGGQGIIRDWSGKSEGEHVCLAPEYLELASPGLKGVYWDHAAYQPDVVVINLGTDFDAGMLDAKEYLEVFSGFVMRVRTVYPLSHIILVESNFHSDVPGTEGAEIREQLRLTLEAVVARGHAAGDRWISFAEAGYYAGTPGDTHLTVEQHELLADEIEDDIREVAGWE